MDSREVVWGEMDSFVSFSLFLFSFFGNEI